MDYMNIMECHSQVKAEEAFFLLVHDLNELKASLGSCHGDLRRPCIKAVLDHFLHGGCGFLHYLARRNPVDHMLFEPLNLLRRHFKIVVG